MTQRISGTPGTVGAAVPKELPATALETTRDNPWPIAYLANKIKGYVERMSPVWVEGEIAEYSNRSTMSFYSLRDLLEEASVSAHIYSSVLNRLENRPKSGDHVVVQLKAAYWPKSGRMSMNTLNLEQVGLGNLLARLERLKNMLAAEGLFDPARKKKLPFLPHCIGLITGRNSDAEKDVLQNARLRWPAVQFKVLNTAVQGSGAVEQIVAALQQLDSDPGVDVIVLARGGGSFEDLLTFSNETLVRSVANATTPVVAAIGHEADHPLVDDVADLRASTPTDAAKRIVPDYNEEVMKILQARASLDGCMERLLSSEMQGLSNVRSRPVLAQPQSMITTRQDHIHDLRARAWTMGAQAVGRAYDSITHLRTQVRALSPLNTLARGYAIVQDPAGQAVRDATSVSTGTTVTVTVERGTFEATVTTVHPSTR